MRGHTGGKGTQVGSKIATDWWPVDKLLLTYLGIAGLLIGLFRQKIPFALSLIALHAGCAFLVYAAARRPGHPWAKNFRYWYPLAYVPICYKELNLLIPAIRGTSFDPVLAGLDETLFGVQPTVWMARFQSPVLSEAFQIAYCLYFPAFAAPGVMFWRKRRLEEFRSYAFLLTLGFLISYAFYILVPCRGPRFELNDLQPARLAGSWFFHFLRDGLDRLEGVHYDCFPSAHVAITMLACGTAQRLSRKLFWVLWIYLPCMMLSTVYLSYHYVIDLVAGVALGWLLLALARCSFRPPPTHQGSPAHNLI